MKVELVVVQGKPEGRVIPLVGSRFKIGRGEGCNLRPNSEEVSREHAEFIVSATTVSVRDLGSRNGTLVNGKVIKEAWVLKDRDLVQVGPLTFAVSIVGAPAALSAAAPVYSKAAPEDVSHDDIETWLIADNKNPAPDRPSGVYGGETITINAYNDANTTKDSAAPAEPKASKPAAAAPAASSAPKVAAKPVAAKPVAAKPVAPSPAPAAAAAVTDYSDLEFERLSEGAGDAEDEQSPEVPSGDESEEKADEVVDEFVDESNPFYVKKKAPEPASSAKKAPAGDTSDAARDILSKMMERKRGPR